MAALLLELQLGRVQHRLEARGPVQEVVDVALAGTSKRHGVLQLHVSRVGSVEGAGQCFLGRPQSLLRGVERELGGVKLPMGAA
ncbi:MAG: hypothetical protein COY47_06610, partial [Chloroflexi bacterium CG_4_10_14_0_8_um_filter_57_5]